jgi:penicillin-binding protein 1A
MKHMAESKSNNDFRSKFNRIFWWVFSIGILCVTLLFFFISIGWLGYLPAIDQLQNPINKYATELYSSDLKLFGSFSEDKDNRIKINYDQISNHVVNALIATEDERFMIIQESMEGLWPGSQ